MHLSWRDGLATVLVAVAVAAYGAWALGDDLVGSGGVDAVAVAILALGMAASVSAVVPGFAGLWHGSRLYLVIASALGVVALGAGVVAVVASEPAALGVLVLSSVALWTMSTARHVGVRRSVARPSA